MPQMTSARTAHPPAPSTPDGLELPALLQRMRHDGLVLQTGPFITRLRLYARYTEFARQIQTLYSHTPMLADTPDLVSDFSLVLAPPRSIRRWLKPKVHLYTDIETPFLPFPEDHALPLFEWGLNWCIGMQAHRYLMLHSAVVAKNDIALVMPALSGSGKSTLCAALMLRGWRLLSDEFGILRPSDPDFMLHPLPRPIPLKNESIEVIRQFDQEAVLGPVFPNTRKGDVAHLAPTPESQLNWQQPAAARMFLFPAYAAGAATRLERTARGHTFLKLSGNSFNYRLHGARGFATVADMVDRVPAWTLRYSRLDEAVSAIDRLFGEVTSGAEPSL